MYPGFSVMCSHLASYYSKNLRVVVRNEKNNPGKALSTVFIKPVRTNHTIITADMNAITLKHRSVLAPVLFSFHCYIFSFPLGKYVTFWYT